MQTHDRASFKQGNQKGERGFSLITVVFVMLALSSLGIGLTTNLSTMSHGSIEELDYHKVFYVADGGLQTVLSQQFLGDTDYSDNVAPTPAPYEVGGIALGDGTFWVEYSSQSVDAVTLTVTAQINNSIRIVRQTITKPPSEAFGYAMYSQDNMNINGGNGTINGSISSGGNISNNDGWTINGGQSSSNTVELPEVNVVEDYSPYTDSSHAGDLTISGEYNQNIYVTGNVTIAAGTTINGIIVTAGNAEIGDNVTLNGMLAATGNIGSAPNVEGINFTGTTNSLNAVLPLLVAEGSITMNTAKDTTVEIDGYIMAEGSIHLNTGKDSTLVIDGLLISHNLVQINNQGNVTLNYDAAMAANLSSGTGSITLSDWQEL